MTNENVQRWPLARLRTWDLNPRRHDDRSVSAIAESLRTFGQQRPVVVRDDGVILAGNGTFEAAQRLGWAELEVVVFTGTESQAKGYAIADNRTAELSKWIYQAVAEEIRAVSPEDLSALGWTADEREVLLAAAWPASAPMETAHPRNTRVHHVTLTDEQRGVVDHAVATLAQSLGRRSRLRPGTALVMIARGVQR